MITRELVAKGAMSALVFLSDDVRGPYETLQARGVIDFTMGVRDPFGNAIRILQQGKVAAQKTMA